MIYVHIDLPCKEEYLRRKGISYDAFIDGTDLPVVKPEDTVITEPRFLPIWRKLPDGVTLLVLPSLQEDSPLLREAPPVPPSYPEPPVDRIEKLLSSGLPAGLDVETEPDGAPNELRDRLLGVGIAIGEETFFGTPDHRAYMDLLKELPPVYAWNGKYDLAVLRRYGIRLSLRGDGCIAAYLLGEPDASLKKRVQAHFGVMLSTLQQVTGGLPPSLRDLSSYCQKDAYWAVKMTQALEEEIRSRGMEEAYRLELEMVPILLSMQERGVGFDRRRAARRLRECKRKLRSLENALRALAEQDGFVLPPSVKRCPVCKGGKKKRLSCERCKGEGKRSVPRELNPSSVPQVRQWLISSGRFVPKRTTAKGDPQLAALDLLRNRKDPACLLLLTHRALSKEISFLKQWSSASRKTGRIHTVLTNTKVVSGRLSSRDPNLQQVRPEWRDLFIP